MFDDILRISGYPEDSIDQTKHPQSHQRNSPPPNVDWSYLKIPYMSERLNHKITNIFRKEGIQYVSRTDHTPSGGSLAQRHSGGAYMHQGQLSHLRNQLCLLRNAVYQITCNNCNQHYIGSTTRLIHDRVKEHLNSENTSPHAKTKTTKALKS